MPGRARGRRPAPRSRRGGGAAEAGVRDDAGAPQPRDRPAAGPRHLRGHARARARRRRRRAARAPARRPHAGGRVPAAGGQARRGGRRGPRGRHHPQEPHPAEHLRRARARRGGAARLRLRPHACRASRRPRPTGSRARCLHGARADRADEPRRRPPLRPLFAGRRVLSAAHRPAAVSRRRSAGMGALSTWPAARERPSSSSRPCPRQCPRSSSSSWPRWRRTAIRPRAGCSAHLERCWAAWRAEDASSCSCSARTTCPTGWRSRSGCTAAPPSSTRCALHSPG